MYILGVDIGTTGTKAMLVREDGRIMGRAYKAYPLSAIKENCVEQNAEDWWDTLVCTVRECTGVLEHRHAIRAISVSTQGGSMVPMDEYGNCLGNAMVWMDSRGSAEVDSLLSIKGDDWFYVKTGWKLAIGLNAVKIAWLKNNERSIFNKTAKYITTLDYINY
jgi:sugar (pentulose or hexulose) kinase